MMTTKFNNGSGKTALLGIGKDALDGKVSRRACCVSTFIVR